MRATNFPDGIEGSMVQSRLLHSVEKSAKIVNLSFLLNDCSSADLLSGSVIELPLLFSAEGRQLVGSRLWLLSWLLHLLFISWYVSMAGGPPDVEEGRSCFSSVLSSRGIKMSVSK